MVERVFPKRPSRCGAMEGSGQAGAGALVGMQQPLKAGSLAASCRRQAPCTASLVVPAPLGPQREAPGLLQLWGVLLRGESTALGVGSLGEWCRWDFPVRGICGAPGEDVVCSGAGLVLCVGLGGQHCQGDTKGAWPDPVPAPSPAATPAAAAHPTASPQDRAASCGHGPTARAQRHTWGTQPCASHPGSTMLIIQVCPAVI